MKFSTAVLFLVSFAGSLSSSLTLASISGHDDDEQQLHPNLRTATGNLKFDASPCNDIKDERKCFSTKDDKTNESCVWCDCQAVPSVCVTVSF
jgi:hypothetical protein